MFVSRGGRFEKENAVERIFEGVFRFFNIRDACLFGYFFVILHGN